MPTATGEFINYSGEKVNEVLTDFRGHPIEVGSTVVYPSRQGSSLWVVEATVLKVTREADSHQYLRETKTWGPVPTWSLKVQTKQDSNGYSDFKSRVTTLSVLDRVVVVS